MVNATEQKPRHRVVIVGGGFGGLYAAKTLSRANVDVTLVDKRNFHLFQPLLYQVATGTLSPSDISSPLRSVLSACKNVRVLMEEVVDINPETQKIILEGEELPYDSLIVATGVSHHYFGNDQWKETAPGLKTVEDALEMRRRIFSAFEAAEKEADPARRQALMTFVVVGGGPTGVELAGAIAELAFNILKEDFRTINTADAQVLLLEGLDRILPPYAPELSAKAEASLTHLGVKVLTKARVTNIQEGEVTLTRNDQTEVIPAHTILWAAGVKASAMGAVLAQRTGVGLDRVGRVMVEADFSIPNHPNIFVIGDLANFTHQGDKPLPGVAPVAMQAGQYVGQLIQKRLKNQTVPTFTYVDKGSLAIIGQNAAVVDLGFIRITGFLAWIIWLFAHLYYLIEFDNKLLVMIQWAWNYFTRSRGARIITGDEVFYAPAAEGDPSREFQSVVKIKTPVEA